MNALVRIQDALGSTPRLAHGGLTDLPPEAPLDMQPQRLSAAPSRRWSLRPTTATLRLSGLILATALMTVLAMSVIYRVLAADTVGPLDMLIMALEAPLFAWSAFSFLSALAGFIAGFGEDESGLATQALGALASRNAVLLPIYNEAPKAVFARLQAICESVEAAGTSGDFDFFVLSDSTDSQIGAEEHRRFLTLKWRMGSTRVFYRRRALNTERKAGNIADWVRRFGGAYDHMVVLDADSLMEGATLVRLAAAMEREPEVGLIQTAPAIVNRHTLFSRAEQFASRLYGPMLARGVAWWSGSEGNYWGHNAIIRVAAFAEHAGLPHLRGRKPFGGHILSHDFVEAALLRRAGWRVRLAADMGGSYEESPPTLAALLARDRRWCQGNLQHVKVLCARGLHWVSRFHLLRGVSAYLVSPMWLSLLAAAALLPLRPEWGVRPGAVHAHAGALTADLNADTVVFGVTLAFLLAPKALALLEILRNPQAWAPFGGRRIAALNVALETVLSGLVAPLIMVSHTRSLAAVVAGRDSGWAAQARDENSSSLLQTARLHAPDTLLGLGLTAAAVASSSVRALLWMTPVLAGLTLAAPLTAAIASAALGRAARRSNLLLVPEEQRPPQVLARANALFAAHDPFSRAPSAPRPATAAVQLELATVS